MHALTHSLSLSLVYLKYMCTCSISRISPPWARAGCKQTLCLLHYPRKIKFIHSFIYSFSVSLRSIIMITSLDHSVSYLLFYQPTPPPVLLFCFCLCFLLFWPLVCFVASDFLTTICHLAFVNVCVIIILSIGNTQISLSLIHI